MVASSSICLMVCCSWCSLFPGSCAGKRIVSQEPLNKARNRLCLITLPFTKKRYCQHWWTGVHCTTNHNSQNGKLLLWWLGRTLSSVLHLCNVVSPPTIAIYSSDVAVQFMQLQGVATACQICPMCALHLPTHYRSTLQKVTVYSMWSMMTILHAKASVSSYC